MSKLMGVFMDFDKMVGKDFEAGLAALEAQRRAGAALSGRNEKRRPAQAGRRSIGAESGAAQATGDSSASRAQHAIVQDRRQHQQQHARADRRPGQEQVRRDAVPFMIFSSAPAK